MMESALVSLDVREHTSAPLPKFVIDGSTL